MPNPRVVAEFRRRQAKQRGLTWRGVAYGIVGLVGPWVMPPPFGRIVAGICLFVLVGILGFTLAGWRCPACGRLLGRKLDPRACPHCGEAFVDAPG